MPILHTVGAIPGKEGEQQIAILKDDTHLSRWIEQQHRLDADDQDLLSRIFDLIPTGGVVVDAGASLGDHTSRYATKAGLVHAFEPQPESFECLRENCEGLNVRMYRCGLSDHEGELTIARHANVGASPIAEGGDIPIRVITLDSLGLAPALIKMDVEGHEVKALRGARLTILRFRPVLVIEVNKWALEPGGSSIRELWKELRGLEYAHCVDIRTGQPFDPADGRPEYDIVGMP
jgi:FkbM family methyltransferase